VGTENYDIVAFYYYRIRNTVCDYCFCTCQLQWLCGVKSMFAQIPPPIRNLSKTHSIVRLKKEEQIRHSMRRAYKPYLKFRSSYWIILCR